MNTRKMRLTLTKIMIALFNNFLIASDVSQGYPRVIIEKIAHCVPSVDYVFLLYASHGNSFEGRRIERRRKDAQVEHRRTR